jgi:hypothetical protein
MYQTQMRPHLFEHAHRRLVVRIAHETCVIAPAAIISNIPWASRDCRATTALGFFFPARLALHRRRHTRRRHSSARA